MTVIAFGNTAPIQPVKVDDTTAVERIVRPDLGNQTTFFNVPDHVEVGQALLTVTSVFASHHSDDKPAWIESDDQFIANILARQYDCPIGRPDDWVDGPQEGPVEETDTESQTITSADVVNVSSILTTPGTSV